MQLGYIFIHPRVYEISRVHGFCTSCFSFEVQLHHSTNIYIYIYICEEAWEKGPIASKYCFEKNAFKVSQIFTKEAWEKEPIASKYCFVKAHLKKFANIYIIQ